MKRIITVIIVILAAVAASAQPKSAGLRFGATGIDASYQHVTLNEDEFVECNLGLDFGAKGKAGFKIACAYNIVLARPQWTDSGSWTIYAGPAAAMGNVYDMVTLVVCTDPQIITGILKHAFDLDIRHIKRESLLILLIKHI